MDTSTVRVELGERSYDITVGHGILECANKYMNLDRRIFIVTDSGVPKEYSDTVAALCKNSTKYIFPAGEASKNIETYSKICKAMLDFGMQRGDAVIAVGGGVVGDVAGFAAATYMRGIDFYNIPTTLLSQVDSSIGGKTAIDFGGIKNILGAFHQPRAVLIDTSVLKTLDKKQFSSGLAEVIKMALTSDAELFSIIESGITEDNLAQIILRALNIKKRVVEADEREGGIRKILNFGHTLGHGIEALGGLLHGECVALGMIPMCDSSVRKRLIPVLKKANLPTDFIMDINSALEYARHDKKGDGNKTDVIFVNEIGKYSIEKLDFDCFAEHIKKNIL